MQQGQATSNFERVGTVEPERDGSGTIAEFRPQTNQPLHKYGGGPFCRFRIAQGAQWQRSGVYVLTCRGQAHYVGECKNLSMIWHSVGNITQTSVAPKGRQTHCRLNTLILDESKKGSELVLWFQTVEEADARSALKAELIESRNPAWNLLPPGVKYEAGWQDTGVNEPLPSETQTCGVSPQQHTSFTPGSQGLRRFAGLQFSYVGRILPERDSSGQIIEDYPHRRFRNEKRLPLSKYGSGPFCRFRVAKGWQRSGVYILTRGSEVRYIGDAENLERRWGGMGYGQISPRACFQGGQDTNCRINNLILQETKAGGELHLWFHPVEGQKYARRAVEAQLIVSLQPRWNR